MANNVADISQPQASLLSNHSDRSLLVKILAELRVQTLIMAQGFGVQDDITALRNEVMSQGNSTLFDL